MKVLLIMFAFCAYNAQAQTLFRELKLIQPEEIEGGSNLTNAQRAYERYKEVSAGMAEYQECLRRIDQIPQDWAPNLGDKLVFLGENSIRTLQLVDGSVIRVARALTRMHGVWEPTEVTLSSVTEGKEKVLGWNLYASDYLVTKNHKMPLVDRLSDKGSH